MELSESAQEVPASVNLLTIFVYLSSVMNESKMEGGFLGGEQRNQQRNQERPLFSSLAGLSALAALLRGLRVHLGDLGRLRGLRLDGRRLLE